MAGYEDIENWSRQQDNLLSQQEAKQNQITQQQTQMNIDELNRDKDKIDTEVNKTTSGLYTNYQKEANQYGVEAEKQAKLGLANSGYSETARTNLYNTYQKNVTDTLNNARNLKADFDFKINQARQTGDITMAQNALALYNQKMQLLTQEYEMRNNREQFLYQKSQDSLAQSNWEREFAQSQNQWQQTFDYQKQRDAVADSQWEQEYALSKKALASSKKTSSSGSSRSSGNLNVNDIQVNDNPTYNNSTTSQQNNSGVDRNALANKVSAVLAMAQKDVNPNKTGAKNLINSMYKQGQLTKDERDEVYKMIGG